MPFLGMRGTGDWGTNEVPDSWRKMILYLWPNGEASLTGIMSQLSSERLTSTRHHWFEKELSAQAADVTNIYTDQAMGNAYTASGVKDDTLYVKVAQSFAEEVRTGHQVLLRSIA